MFRRHDAASWRTFLLGIAGLMLALLFQGCPRPETGGQPSDREPTRTPPRDGTRGTSPTAKNLVHEVRSDFSHIRIRDRGSVRFLYFVRDSGVEVVETAIDLEAPHKLVVPYTRTMFAGHLFRPSQETCLIVGLGGGGMVRFLNHFFPEIRVDAVEIDPVVVKVADDFFGTRPGPKTRIFTEDAFDYLERTREKYDVIYMDAFLKPGESTDATGIPLRLKTIAFYKSLHGKLKEEGMVVFNLNPHPGAEEDIETIRKAFPQVYVFRVPRHRNTVVVGSLSKERRSREALEAAGKELDGRLDTGFSFQAMAGHLR